MRKTGRNTERTRCNDSITGSMAARLPEKPLPLAGRGRNAKKGMDHSVTSLSCFGKNDRRRRNCQSIACAGGGFASGRTHKKEQRRGRDPGVARGRKNFFEGRVRGLEQPADSDGGASQNCHAYLFEFSRAPQCAVMSVRIHYFGLPSVYTLPAWLCGVSSAVLK